MPLIDEAKEYERRLRDEFAKTAMHAMLASGGCYQTWTHLAQDSYEAADAMLKVGKETDNADD